MYVCPTASGMNRSRSSKRLSVKVCCNAIITYWFSIVPVHLLSVFYMALFFFLISMQRKREGPDATSPLKAIKKKYGSEFVTVSKSSKAATKKADNVTKAKPVKQSAVQQKVKNVPKLKGEERADVKLKKACIELVDILSSKEEEAPKVAPRKRGRPPKKQKTEEQPLVSETKEEDENDSLFKTLEERLKGHSERTEDSNEVRSPIHHSVTTSE